MTEPVWTDPKTGLQWSATSPRRMSWEDAKAWCEGLGDGWRMPTLDELLTLVDRSIYDPAVVAPLRGDDSLTNLVQEADAAIARWDAEGK